jgi:uncharacterized protein (TIGR03000 family)
LGAYRARYGFYRPYYGLGLGLGLGYGLGYGLGGYGYYTPYYGAYGGGPGYASGYYSPDVASPAVGALPEVGTPDAGTPDVGPAPQERPPQDNAAHLQLIVPEGAEVFFDGAKTSKTGRLREFVSPTLAPGQTYTYTIEVRSTAAGKPVVDRREIHVGANDWFMVDFTRPAPANAPTGRPGAGPVMPPAADK